MKQESTHPEEQRSPHEAELAEAIIAYLREHPQAMDTLEGIAEWWLMRQRVRQELALVARAVESLTAEGLIEPVSATLPCLYRLKQPPSPADSSHQRRG